MTTMSKPTYETPRINRLPNEHIRSVTLRRMIITIVSTAIVMVAINGVAIAVLRQFNPNRYMVISQSKWKLLNQLQEPGVNLIVGDSSANQGVDPDVFREKLGGRWVNLGTMANLMLLDDTWMLQQYIDQHGPPTRLVMVHVPESFHRQVHGNAFAQVPLPWGYWNRVDPQVSFGAKQTVEIALARYVPLYASNQSLRTVIMHPDAVRLAQPPLRDDGFMPVISGNPDLVNVDANAPANKKLADKPAISALNEAALTRILELAEQHSFPVYLAYSPVYDQFWAHESTQTELTKLQRELQTIAARHPTLHLLLDEPMQFPLSDMADTVDHVIYSASKRYSSELAARIANIESPPHSPPHSPAHTPID